MEIAKSLHPQFTDIFFTEQPNDDIHHHRFTPGIFFQKDALWQGLCLFLCVVVFASAQHGFKADEEYQRNSQTTMDNETWKQIWPGKSIMLPTLEYYSFECQLTIYMLLMEMVFSRKNNHIEKVWLILDALATKEKISHTQRSR